MIAKARGSDQALFNNAAQAGTTASTGIRCARAATGPSGELLRMIDDAFGSLDELKKQLAERGAGHFASGWVWLAEQGRQAVDRGNPRRRHAGRQDGATRC